MMSSWDAQGTLRQCFFMIFPSSWTHYPPQVSSSRLKAKWVPCSGRVGTCAVRTQTRRRGWEDDCVSSNPTSSLSTHTQRHTLYTNPHTLIKGILGPNREGGADCYNEQRRMARRCVCLSLRKCDCLHASISKGFILMVRHAWVCMPLVSCLAYTRPRKGVCDYVSVLESRHVHLYVHARIPLFSCSRVCAERPGFQVLA